MASSFRQAISTGQKLFNTEVQPTLFQDSSGYFANLKFLFRDRRADAFIPPPLNEKLQSICSWINSVETTTGIEVELRPSSNIISIGSFNSSVPDFDLLQTPYARNELNKALRSNDNNCLYTLTREERLALSLDYLKRAGLEPVETTEVSIPFFSPHQPIKFLLIRVRRNPK